MEKQGKYFDHTGRYSVRLRNADGEQEYLGTGTLLIRQKDERVWLLTCVHTLFQARVEPKGEDGGGSMAYVPIRRLLVEYKANAAQNHAVVIEIRPGSGDGPAEADALPGTVMAGGYQGRYEGKLPCEEDFICLKLDWELWMAHLPDISLEPARESDSYVGYGFHRDVNGRQVGESGTLLNVVASNINPMKFSFKYSHDPGKDHWEEMAGFSGTGLFVPGSEGLAGIVCEEYCNADNEVWAVSVSAFEEQWNQPPPVSLDEVCLVRCLHTPSGTGGILPSMRLEFNLFAILSGIRGEAMVFLLNGEGEPLSKALSVGSLRKLIPNRVWNFSEALRLGGRSVNGVVVPMEDREQDWRRAEQLVGNLSGAGLTGQSSKLVLFNIDVSSMPQEAEAPLNFQKVVRRISEAVMGTQQFYLFSTDGLMDHVREPYTVPEKALTEAVEKRHGQAQKEAHPYQFLIQEAERWPGIALRLAERCSKPDSGSSLRLAGFRLAVLYSAVASTRGVWSVFQGEKCAEFLAQELYPSLPVDEKLDLLGSLALNGAEGAALWETIVGGRRMEDAEAYGADAALDALQKLFDKPAWTGRDFEEAPELLAPAFFRILLRCLNRSWTSPEQKRWTLLEALGESRGKSQYWRLLLGCRWKTAAVCRQLQDADRLEGQFLPLLLDLHPNRNDGAWSMADSIRSDLFP